MYLSDLHTHTIASGHGSTETITDIAKAASLCKLQLLGITEHAPATPNSCKDSYFRSLTVAPRKRFGVDLLYGVELNIMDFKGKVDLSKETLETLDYAIISMHPPILSPGSKEEHLQAYLKGMCHPKVKIIGHCDDTRYPVDYKVLVSSAKEHGVIIEINNSSLAPWGYRGDTRKNMLELINLTKRYQHPIILSSDSHGSNNIGDFSFAHNLVKEAALPDNLILNNQIPRLKEFLKRKKV